MNLNQVSKFISLILRHKPEEIDIELDEHGYAKVDELIEGIKSKRYKDFNIEVLNEIVKTDSKQRYSFNEDKTLIRANQGHSIKVDLGLEEMEPPEYLYHGTGEKYVESIESIGIIAKSRMYVHLSRDIDTAIEVGKRHGKVVVYKVLTKKMYVDGYKFYISKNNVWLTDSVPVRYIEKIDI